MEDSCFSTSLAKANSQNKKYLRSFIAAAIPDGETYYNAALNKAFQYFQNADKDDVDAGHRGKKLFPCACEIKWNYGHFVLLCYKTLTKIEA